MSNAKPATCDAVIAPGRNFSEPPTGFASAPVGAEAKEGSESQLPEADSVGAVLEPL